MAGRKIACALLFVGVSLAASLNDRPIIGVLTQPSLSDLAPYGSSYIAASYVKYLEAGGARVVPVFHNATTEELDATFSSINGLLFPGGDASIDNTTFSRAAQYMYNKALQSNDNGDYFPIVGHCLGFELLAVLTSGNVSILSWVDAENISMPLDLTSNAKSSRWLGSVPADILNILVSEPVTLNNHQECVTPDDFAASESLSSFYRVLSTNQDRQGKTFVSTWEGIKYPIYGAQWHSEKPQFEWNPTEDINHSPDAIMAMQYFGRFFVDEARKSFHKYPSPQAEQAALIYNYAPIYTAPFDWSFEQCYVF